MAELRDRKSYKRRVLPADAAILVAEVKSRLGMRDKVARISDSVELFHKPSQRQLVIRRVGRAGSPITSGRAMALSGCKGTSGSAFYTCVKSAFGKAPRKLELKYGGGAAPAAAAPAAAAPAAAAPAPAAAARRGR